MYKSIAYDRRMLRRRGRHAMEFEALHDFITSEHENMIFEYVNHSEANVAANAIKREIKNERMPLDAYIAEHIHVVVVRAALKGEQR